MHNFTYLRIFTAHFTAKTAITQAEPCQAERRVEEPHAIAITIQETKIS